jgi:hypothetical protein
MESGNHFKNGATLKSHTSRRNFNVNRLLLILVALISGLTFSCKEGDGKPWSGKIESYGYDLSMNAESKSITFTTVDDGCDRPQQALTTPSVSATKNGNRI